MEGGDDEVTLLVGDDGAGDSCALIGGGDLDAGDYASGGVGDGADDGAETLGEDGTIA